MTSDLPVEGRCWSCHRLNIDHTIGEMDVCLDMPISLVVVEDQEDQEELDH
jgi:hypothetical protein